ncbi:MAG: pectate lyase [Planctomycetaceae bacterium]
MVCSAGAAHTRLFRLTATIVALCILTALTAHEPFVAIRGQPRAQRPESPENIAEGAELSSVAPVEQPLTAIDISGFLSGIHHWRDLRDDNRFIQVEPNQPAYRPEQVREIVSNILLFQRENGGWPKDYDMTAVLTTAQRRAVEATRMNADASFDNGNIHSQVEYLARAFVQSGEQSWRRACERGFDFILQAQYANGGFPQRFPTRAGYHAHITFNDGVMIGILDLLQDASEQKPHFEWLDDARREAAARAVRSAIDCILTCQIRVNGIRTGWCQQHDEHTLEASSARTFELASICPQETADIVRFLMRQPTVDAQVLAATDAAIAWLRHVQLPGIRVERVKARAEKFLRHTVDYDIVVVPDKDARPIWARHYEIGTNSPVFAGRDGIRKYSLAEIERERRTGTLWYGYWPEELLNGSYATWRRSVPVSE